MLAMFNANPIKQHIAYAKQVFCYVKYTLDYTIKFLQLAFAALILILIRFNVYVNALYNTNLNNSKFFAKYIVYVNSIVIA